MSCVGFIQMNLSIETDEKESFSDKKWQHPKQKKWFVVIKVKNEKNQISTNHKKIYYEISIARITLCS